MAWRGPPRTRALGDANLDADSARRRHGSRRRTGEGADDYLPKPKFEPRELLARLKGFGLRRGGGGRPADGCARAALEPDRGAPGAPRRRASRPHRHAVRPAAGARRARRPCRRGEQPGPRQGRTSRGFRSLHRCACGCIRQAIEDDPKHPATGHHRPWRRLRLRQGARLRQDGGAMAVVAQDLSDDRRLPRRGGSVRGRILATHVRDLAGAASLRGRRRARRDRARPPGCPG